MPTSRKSKELRAQQYVLKLYVSGATDRSRRAISNLNSIYAQFLQGHCDLEVIDIYQFPDAATEADVLAAPTLIRKLPLPAKRILGDLSERNRVLVLLDLKKKIRTYAQRGHKA